VSRARSLPAARFIVLSAARSRERHALAAHRRDERLDGAGQVLKVVGTQRRWIARIVSQPGRAEDGCALFERRLSPSVHGRDLEQTQVLAPAREIERERSREPRKQRGGA
jgi:hypothetical protein